MGFRASLFITGIVATVLSFFVGLWSAWVGIPLMFMSSILHFIDRE